MRGLLATLSGATVLCGMTCSASSNVYGIDVDPQTTTATWPAPSSSNLLYPTASACNSPNAVNTTVAKTLVAGASRVDITPAVNRTWLPLNQYEHEKLWVRAIVFQSQGVTSALIGSDLSNIEEVIYQDTVARVSALLNTPVENIILSSTHTHGATPCGSALFSTAENYGCKQAFSNSF